MREAGSRAGRLLLLLAPLLVATAAPAQERARASRPSAAGDIEAAPTSAPTRGATRQVRPRWRSASAPAAPGTPGRDLFVYPDDGGVLPPTSSPAAVAEVRVAVDVFALAASDRATVDLVLPDGSRYQAVPEEIVRRDAASFLWRGRLIGARQEGDGVITVHRGQVAGRLTLPHRLLELVPDRRGEGMTTLRELDDSLFPPCGGQVEPAEAPAPASGAIAAASEQPPWIDVLVVYTPKARRAAGGTPQIEATIQAAVDVTNDAYANSRVKQRLYLVHMREIAYDETGFPMAEQLDWLRTAAPVADLRERYGADAVAMIAESPDFCGQGYVMRDVTPSFDRWAFSVTHRPCAVGGLTLAHELGHNMGLEHDPPNGPAPEEASYPWSFGHFVPGTFHTVMAYQNPCGRACRGVGHFSNPRVGYRGHATGLAGRRDNARTLDLTAPVFERFRVGLADPPSNFSLTVGRDRGVLVSRAVYTLRWSPHPLATGYQVYRIRAGGSLSRIPGAAVSGTSYVETGPVDEEGRGYAVAAVLDDGSETRRTVTVYAGDAQ